MGTPGVGSPHTLFLFSTPLTARETTSTVHWPIGRVDGYVVKRQYECFSLTYINIQKSRLTMSILFSFFFATQG